MRRKKGALVPFEQRIMDVIGDREMHGSAIAAELGIERRHGLGSLYRALARLERYEDLRRLVSRLEDAEIAEKARRPRRRLYQRRPAQRSGVERQGAE